MSYRGFIATAGIALTMLLLQISLGQADERCLKQLGGSVARQSGKKVVIDEDPFAERLNKNSPKFDPDAPEIKTSKLQKPYRVLRPQDPITMDYNPNRININVDDDYNFITANCG